MRKPKITLIIVLSSIALVGLITTQSFWVWNAINLAERQHDHRIDMALSDVVNEVKDALDPSFGNQPRDVRPRSTVDLGFFDLIDTTALASSLEKYVEYHKLDDHYEYAIVKTANDSIFYASSDQLPRSLKRNVHKGCLGCVWKDDFFHLEVFFPSQRTKTLLGMSLWLALSGIFILIVIFSFMYIINTIIRQKKISAMKNDFINNMTHEFKTPISTISLASEVLLQSAASGTDPRVSKYSRIIYDENLRMQGQVERVLQIARLDKGEIKLKPSRFDLHKLVRDAVQNFCIEKCEEQTTIHYHFGAENHDLYADEMHIKNVVVNLVDNAIKYSPNGKLLNIYTVNREEGILLSVEDNGMGMPPEAIRHIFDKFYRVPTGNLHDVKGFGLGLFYVKNTIDAHGGYVEVRSELNKGSRFDVYLPLDTPA